jgi:tetratricopeptide (TPR) repeat protein
MRHPDEVRDGIGYMRAAVAVKPQSSHAVMNLGNGYSFLGDQDQSIACYRKAIELSPGYYNCYSNLGVALIKKGQYEEAINAFAQAIKLSPDHATNASAYLAMILSNCRDARLRDPSRAAALAENAVKIEPNAGDYWTSLGVARYRNGQWRDACAALNKSLELGTGGTAGDSMDDREAIDEFFLAMSHWQLGQHEEAKQSFYRALKWIDKKPNHDEQLNRIRVEAEELLDIGNKTNRK